MKLKKIIRYGAYLVFGIFIFTFFTYLNFPYNKLKDMIFGQIQTQSGIILDASNLKPTLTFGMTMEDLNIAHQTSQLAPLRIPEISVSPSLLSLAILKPKISFQAQLLSGDISGALRYGGQGQQSIHLNLNDVNLQRNFKEQLPINLMGTATGKIDFSGDFRQSNTLQGETQLKIEKFALGQMTVLNMTIPDIQMSNAVLQGKLKSGRFEISKCELGSPKDDIHMNVSGNILLNIRPWDQSRLSLDVKLKLSEKIKEEFKAFLPFIASALGKDGYYNLRVSGRLSAPVALPKQG